ncbi:acyl carrier protein [Paenibacillus elgii]|uniref:Acyl carrier protein n=3 Tax=Paenibacillus TaxID=44249 RepID=A0A2T6FTK6_9BACL|nr:acyl carrier protein [Paenibacillus elgii]
MGMLQIDTLLDIIRTISGKERITPESSFVELEMDSTNLVEVLIELEMVMNVDILDANLNFYEMEKVSDVYDYVARLGQ